MLRANFQTSYCIHSFFNLYVVRFVGNPVAYFSVFDGLGIVIACTCESNSIICFDDFLFRMLFAFPPHFELAFISTTLLCHDQELNFRTLFSYTVKGKSDFRGWSLFVGCVAAMPSFELRSCTVLRA